MVALLNDPKANKTAGPQYSPLAAKAVSHLETRLRFIISQNGEATVRQLVEEAGCSDGLADFPAGNSNGVCQANAITSGANIGRDAACELLEILETESQLSAYEFADAGCRTASKFVKLNEKGRAIPFGILHSEIPYPGYPDGDIYAGLSTGTECRVILVYVGDDGWHLDDSEA
jgi:hypothetical protein